MCSQKNRKRLHIELNWRAKQIGNENKQMINNSSFDNWTFRQFDNFVDFCGRELYRGSHVWRSQCTKRDDHPHYRLHKISLWLDVVSHWLNITKISNRINIVYERKVEMWLNELSWMSWVSWMWVSWVSWVSWMWVNEWESMNEKGKFCVKNVKWCVREESDFFPEVLPIDEILVEAFESHHSTFPCACSTHITPPTQTRSTYTDIKPSLLEGNAYKENDRER
jgi:hypothetical protein